MSGGDTHRQDDALGAASASPDQSSDLLQVISRSQRNYRELVDHLEQAVFTMTMQGEVRAANVRLSEIFGVEIKDLIGRSLGEYIASPTFAEALRMMPVFLSRGSWEGTVPVRLRNDPALHYFKCWLMAIAEEGETNAICGWARDVTKQFESELRFTEFFDSVREGLFFSMPDGEILDVNPALVRMLGYDSKEELKRINFRNIYVDPAMRDKLIAEILESGSVQDREIVLKKKDGSHIHCLASGFPVRDASGRVLRFQGTLVDFTERLEIGKRLHNEQEFVRRLVTSIPDMIAVVDCSGKYTYVSQRVQDALGYSPEELVGQAVGGRAHPEDQVKIRDLFQELVSGETLDGHLEYRTRHRDGSWRTIRASAGPIFDESGKIAGVVATARDVTEQIQAEHQLAQREKFAAMGQMMTGAAHELNNPLTAILGVSELMRDRATDDAMRRHADLVHTQAKRAALIVQDLLAFARPSFQGKVLIDLEELLREALKSQEESLRRKNITVEFRVAEHMPPITGDRKLLTQVFHNVIQNAEQAISPSQKHGTLRVSVDRQDSRFRVTFADNGPGIPADNLEKVFDPFFTTKRPGGGSGLGLTICLAVIKDHGGTMAVRSGPGQGATVEVFLPAAPEELHAGIQPEAGRKTEASAQRPLEGRSALIVDDEESIREIVEEGLALRGMRVDGVGSSEEALSKLASGSYDVVLCDMNLPGLCGEELHRRVRAQAGQNAPQFVMMTGDMLDPEVVKQFGGNAARILQKPFHTSALVSILTEIFQLQNTRVGPT
jgi:two-component system, NtrC family, sensor kinase